jgi:hypothetical protein
MVFVRQYIPCSRTFSAVEGNGDVKADPVHPAGGPTAFIEGPKRLPKLDDNFLGNISVARFLQYELQTLSRIFLCSSTKV